MELSLPEHPQSDLTRCSLRAEAETAIAINPAASGELFQIPVAAGPGGTPRITSGAVH